MLAHQLCTIASSNFSHLVAWKGLNSHMIGIIFLRGIQHVRLLVSARAYQPANSVFLSQQTSTSRAYQPRNQPTNRPIDSYFSYSILFPYSHALCIYLRKKTLVIYLRCISMVLVFLLVQWISMHEQSNFTVFYWHG